MLHIFKREIRFWHSNKHSINSGLLGSRLSAVALLKITVYSVTILEETVNLYKVQKMFSILMESKSIYPKYQCIKEFLLVLHMTEQVLALLLWRHDIESCSGLLGMCEDLLVALEDLWRFTFLLLLLTQAKAATWKMSLTLFSDCSAEHSM